VRDLLLARPVKDIDLVLEPGGKGASLSESTRFVSALARATGGRVESHERFGTATLTLSGGDSLDVAVARKEVYEHSGALPLVEAAETIDEDLRRRDFTIHAMAVEIAPGRAVCLHDPLGGRRDLARKRLAILHPRSFQDDATRAFRLARYGHRLGFTVAGETRAALAQAVKQGAFDRVSGQRLEHEIELLLSEPDRRGAIRWLARLGLLETLHPSLRADPRALKRVEELERASNRARAQPSWFAYLLAWASDLTPEAAEALARRLALPGARTRVLLSWPATLAKISSSRSLAPSALAALMLTPDEMAAASSVLAGAARRAFARGIQRGQITLSISGRDLLQAGLPPGPRIGQALARTLAARQDGRISKRQELNFALSASEEPRP
jgi:tRNA nucleotidyltransferase (CCA-adding enzyme)